MKQISRCLNRSRIRATLLLSGCLAPLFGVNVLANDPALVRENAIVNLTFDESDGDALDSATAGVAKDRGTLLNGAVRIKSPFWGQTGKQAIVLDSASRQFVQIVDSPDLDHAEAVTVSLFYADLQPAGDTAYRGVIGKRDDTRQVTNYGINYAQSSDAFQVYLNDGTGFKTATYGLAEAVGRHRPVFITAVYQIGDAPAPDSDTDRDDVLIRFYVNGKPIKPKSSTGGVVIENDTWLTDVMIANLLNDVPLVLGASSTTIEHSSCLIDEFSLFARALSSVEVARLFAEVAGPHAATQKITEDTKSIPAGPEIAGVSLHGLTRGQPTVVEVTGTNLLPDPVLIGTVPIEKQVVHPGATAEHVVFEITTSPTAMTGHYALRVQTANGVSSALPMAVDALPQIPYSEFSPDKPLNLPVAVSGVLSGQQQIRIPIVGKAGQRLVIDLECKRLGGAMDPVLELKSPRGAPLHIAWGRPQWRGDTRIEAHLFNDGIYMIELHDLAFKAPGQNHFRLKIGDLKIIDTTFPAAVTAGEQRTVSAIGSGIEPSAKLAVDMQHQVPGTVRMVGLSPEVAAVGPAPGVLSSGAIEIEEDSHTEGKIQTVDARFKEKSHLPVAINGRINRGGESDRYLLQVVPEMGLSFSAESHSFHSPLEPHIEIRSHPEGRLLAASEEKPALEFVVPAGTSAIQLAVTDLNRRGGADFIYRLRMTKSGNPNFLLSLANERVSFPSNGNTVLRFDITRAGYDGPISLSLTGAPDLELTPAEIPAGAVKGLVVLGTKPGDRSRPINVRNVHITGKSTGLDPPIVRAAQVPVDGQMSLVPSARYELTCVLTPRPTGNIELGTLSPAWFRGVDFEIPVSLHHLPGELVSRAVRFSLLTTEIPRSIVDPSDPSQQRRIPVPVVRSLPDQSFQAGENSGVIKSVVPLEVVEGQIDAVLRADFVTDPFSEKVLATVYSSPFRLPVQNAVSVQTMANAVTLSSNSQTEFTGTVKRSAKFSGLVKVSLVNLPEGFSATQVSVPADQEQFQLTVTAPAISTAADLPNIQLRITTSSGSLLQKDIPVAAKAIP